MKNWQNILLTLIGAPAVVGFCLSLFGEHILKAINIDPDELRLAITITQVEVPENTRRVNSLEQWRTTKNQHFAVGKRYNLITNRLQYRSIDGRTHDLTKDNYLSTPELTVYYYQDFEGNRYYTY